MTYIADLKQGVVREKNEMAEPKKKYKIKAEANPLYEIAGQCICPYCGRRSSTALFDMEHDCVYTDYRKHIASLKTYPILPGNWVDGKEYQDSEIEIYDSNKYWWALCEKCGWKGSSEKLDGGGQIADTGDYGDAYCPKCHSIDVDEDSSECKYEGIVARLKQQPIETQSKMWEEVIIYYQEFIDEKALIKQLKKSFSITRK